MAQAASGFGERARTGVQGMQNLVPWVAGTYAPEHTATGGLGEARALPFRVLIVEDEIWAALDIEWVVYKIGAEVVGIASSAEKAIELAESAEPDLALMDIRLAGERDGIDAAIELRQRFDIPSLFVSAHVDTHTRHRAAPARPAGFIDKPFTPELLTRAIQEALNIERRSGPGKPN